MIRGSFHTTYTKCGRQECECFTGKGHMCRRITWTENAKPRTRGVPADHAGWAKKLTEAYKKYRKNRKMIKRSEAKTNKLLDQLEAKIVGQSWESNEGFKMR